MHPLAERRGQRQHRDLHHVVRSGKVIDPAQRLRVDHVFGIVRDHHIEFDAVALFVRQHALVDPVETVGLGRGTVVRAERQVHARKFARGGFDGGNGFFIVGIRAYEEFGGVEHGGRDVPFQHAADHPVFMPERNKNGDAAVRRGIHFRLRGPGEPGLAENMQQYPAGHEGDVQEEVVESADQDVYRKGHQPSGNPGVQGVHPKEVVPGYRKIRK